MGQEFQAQSRSQLVYEPCIVCAANGECRHCLGTGQSGQLVRMSKNTRACWRCQGTGLCFNCKGQKQSLVFAPYIELESSQSRPISITLAAFSGAGWRHIKIPPRILTRSLDQQRGWAAWRVQSHFKAERGLCPLFGIITGYRWYPFRRAFVCLDRCGRLREPDKYNDIIAGVKGTP